MTGIYDRPDLWIYNSSKLRLIISLIMKNNEWKICLKCNCKNASLEKISFHCGQCKKKKEEKSSNSMMHLSTISLIRALLENLLIRICIRLMLKKICIFLWFAFQLQGLSSSCGTAVVSCALELLCTLERNPFWRSTFIL